MYSLRSCAFILYIAATLLIGGYLIGGRNESSSENIEHIMEKLESRWKRQHSKEVSNLMAEIEALRREKAEADLFTSAAIGAAAGGAGLSSLAQPSPDPLSAPAASTLATEVFSHRC